MKHIITKHKIRYKVQEILCTHNKLVTIPMYNGHPYFSLKNLGKKCIIHGKIWVVVNIKVFPYDRKMRRNSENK